MDKECPICFRMTKNKFATCPSCSHEACTMCTKTYLESVYPWDCMHCRHAWTADVVDATMGTVFRKKQERFQMEQHLLCREKLLMDDTRRLLQRNRVERSEKTIFLETLRKERQELQSRLEKVVAAIHEASKDLVFLEEASYHVLSDKSKVGRPCPNETCLGYLSLQEYACTWCEDAFCQQCQSPLKKAVSTQLHSCDPDTVASIMVVMQETKPCPRCRVPIQKSEGCDQMWCTQCHTAFDWSSLRVLPSSPIHNPHLVSFQRDIMEARAPVLSAGLSELALHIFFQQRPLLAAVARDVVVGAFRETENIRRVKLPPLRRSLFQEPLMVNMEARIEYIEGRATESDFVEHLVRRENSTKKRWETFRSLQERVVYIDKVLQNLFLCHQPEDVRRTVVVPLLSNPIKKIDDVA